MKIRLFLFAAALLCAGAVSAAPAPAPGTAKVPAAAAKPCPQQAAHPGQASCPCMAGNTPCPCMSGQSMPCHDMPCAKGAMPAGCPGMQGGMMGPGMMGMSGGMKSAPAAASKSASSGAQQVYGWQLMTPDERAAFQAKMRAAKTPEERAALRAENHKKMQARAQQQGVTLPEVPPGGG